MERTGSLLSAKTGVQASDVAYRLDFRPTDVWTTDPTDSGDGGAAMSSSAIEVKIPEARIKWIVTLSKVKSPLDVRESRPGTLAARSRGRGPGLE
jgi:hypothetical protein